MFIACRGPVMKLYLWDQAAFDFCKKFRSSENTPSVILVTTVYPKRLGGMHFYFLKPSSTLHFLSSLSFNKHIYFRCMSSQSFRFSHFSYLSFKNIYLLESESTIIQLTCLTLSQLPLPTTT